MEGGWRWSELVEIEQWVEMVTETEEGDGREEGWVVGGG